MKNKHFIESIAKRNSSFNDLFVASQIVLQYLLGIEKGNYFSFSFAIPTFALVSVCHIALSEKGFFLNPDRHGYWGRSDCLATFVIFLIP